MADQRTLTPPGIPSGTAPGAETATGESAPHAGQPTPARYAVPFLSGHSGRPDAAGPGALAQGAELVHMAGATGFAGGVYRREDSIKRSRFIVSVAHAPDTATARAFIEAVRGEFADATHNCWAFAAGPPGDTARIGCSD
ncbi:YigZ family protein, partial [Nitratidesulfovibrio liaohensis]|uniref:YigZ family protein n=1 Tax=Nitratidesulfovibrio liaohensis TaxID=2604158 RepID=UPI001AAE494C